MSTAKKSYEHLIAGDILGVRTRIKAERKNPKRKRYANKNRRR